MKAAKSGWSVRHGLYNSNGFYYAHPQIHTPSVEVVYPEEMAAYAQWQAERSMFTAMPEVRWLADLLLERFETPPHAALDLGCGVGRASVYFKKRFHWDDCHFHMYDSDGRNPTYGSFEHADDRSFYNDLQLTRKYLEANDVKQFTMWDAKVSHTLPPVELAYSFLAFGYHFSIDQIMPKLEACVEPGGFVIFGIKGFDAGSGAAGRIYNVQQRQLASVDQSVWKLIRDARGPERMKCSVWVFRRRSPTDGKTSFVVAPEQNEL